jgi:hypothetical protein
VPRGCGVYLDRSDGAHADPQGGFDMATQTLVPQYRDGLAIFGLFAAGLCNIAYFLVFTFA